MAGQAAESWGQSLGRGFDSSIKDSSKSMKTATGEDKTGALEKYGIRG